jgi:hypothetical protein
MISARARWKVFTVSVASLGLLVGQGVGQARQNSQAQATTQKKLTPLYYGAIVCADCHESPKKSDPEPLLCRCTESKIWNEQDKHKNAYAVLRSERAKQMNQLLKIKDATAEKSCLSCHGVDIADPNVKVDRSFKAEEGVSCVACHGAYPDWVDSHGARLQRDKWRAMSREEKEKNYGMTDLWDPAKRAKKCASCHIGNSEEGKVVTHAMYAAGHPPLPGVEVSTFSDAMPRHWEYLKQKQPAAQKLLDYNPDELEKTKLVIIGGVVELEEALKLLAAEAGARARADSPENRLLDLAQIDCYACHHDLKVPSWRQARGYPGIPGRPQFRPWPLALIKLALHHAGQDNQMPELEKKLGALRTAFDVQPFGKLDDVARSAQELAKWCAQLEATLGQRDVKYDRPAAVASLRQLCSLSATDMTDYDTARQMAWAFKTIYSELAESEPKPANNSEIEARLKALDEELKLGLPSGQGHQILDELAAALRKLNDFNPSKVQQIFQELAKLLPSK